MRNECRQPKSKKEAGVNTRKGIWIILFCVIILSGCWDKKELNEVAVVIGVGLDKVKEKEYRVTAQVIKPVPQGGAAGGSELPTWSLSANGKTMMDAIRQLNKISPRRLYWPHLQIIIVGEELAKEGVAPVLTWFERDRDSRSGTYFVQTQGKAEDLLNQKIELGSIPAKAMSDLLDTAELRQIDARRVTLRDFINCLSTPGIDQAIDVINPKSIRGKPETYEILGVAIYSRDRFMGYITGQEAIGIDVVFGRYKYGIITIPIPGSEGDFFSYQVTDMRNQWKLDVRNEKLKVKMNIFIEGNLSDQTGSTELIDPQRMKEAENAIREMVKGSILDTFRQASAMESDIYGIGQELRRYHPKIWHQKEKEWRSELKEIEFDIKINANIRRSGLILKPAQAKMK